MDGAEDRINLDTVRLMKVLYGFHEKETAHTMVRYAQA